MGTVEAESATRRGAFEFARDIVARPGFPRLLLAAAMVAGAVALLWVTRNQFLLYDGWGFYLGYPDLETALEGHSGHMTVTAVGLHKAVIELFGPSGLPFRLILVTLVLICSALLFELLRRRVGDWLALGPAVLFLVFGRGDEGFASPLGIVAMLVIATGLGALLCLERRDRAGDVAACVLLLVGLGTWGPSLVFLLAAAIAVLVGGDDRWRRSWVFLVPLGVYVIWRLWAPQRAQDDVTIETVLAAPDLMLDFAAAGLSATAGVGRGWGTTLVLAASIGLVLLVRSRDERPLSRAVWVIVAALGLYWATLALTDRPPVAGRYHQISFVLVALLFAWVAGGIRLSPRAIAAVLALFAVFAIGNLGRLREIGAHYRLNSEQNRAELAALELVRERVDPAFQIEVPGQPVSEIIDLPFTASIYFDEVDATGSPAFSLEELQGAPSHATDAADVTLARALEVVLRPADRDLRVGGRLEVEEREFAEVTRPGPCLRLRPLNPLASVILALPRGGFTVRLESVAGLALRRFGPSFAVPIDPPGAGDTGVVEIPPDPSPVPWRLEVGPTGPVTICPLRSAPARTRGG